MRLKRWWKYLRPEICLCVDYFFWSLRKIWPRFQVACKTWNCAMLKLNMPRVARVLLVHTNLEIPTQPSPIKTTALSFCIKFWIDTFILLHDFYTQESLVSFLRLAWIFPTRSPSTTFFLSKKSFFFKINCSIFNISFLWHIDGNYRSATAPLVLLANR